MTQPKPLRTLSKDGSIHVTDEFYNTLISSLGAVLFMAGTVFLISSSLQIHPFWEVVSFSIYGICMVFLFISSALHHGIDGSEKTEHFLRQLDYYAIFLSIAGTFTPFCILLLKPPLGPWLLGLVWLLALSGIILKAFFPHLPKVIWVSFYLFMGGLGILVSFPLYRLASGALGCLVLGGLFFMIGAVIYFYERPNPFPGRFGFHEIWHLFVVAGSAVHFSAIYFYLL